MNTKANDVSCGADSGRYYVGQAVEFHAEWPFVTRRGVILEIREDTTVGFLHEHGLGAAIQWEPDRINDYKQSVSWCPFWNARLKPQSSSSGAAK